MSAKINGKSAYVYCVSPTQVNVLSPADASTGPVTVTVTNSGGTSTAVNATAQAALPGLFSASSYVRAVRGADGAVIDSIAAVAKPGDGLQLYGTGFGTAAGAPDTGAVFSGAYPADNPVTVTIGGVVAPVSWAGLVGPGLYQINITVPALADGDHAVVARVGGAASPSTALLKVKGA